MKFCLGEKAKFSKPTSALPCKAGSEFIVDNTCQINTLT